MISFILSETGISHGDLLGNSDISVDRFCKWLQSNDDNECAELSREFIIRAASNFYADYTPEAKLEHENEIRKKYKNAAKNYHLTLPMCRNLFGVIPSKLSQWCNGKRCSNLYPYLMTLITDRIERLEKGTESKRLPVDAIVNVFEVGKPEAIGDAELIIRHIKQAKPDKVLMVDGDNRFDYVRSVFKEDIKNVQIWIFCNSVSKLGLTPRLLYEFALNPKKIGSGLNSTTLPTFLHITETPAEKDAADAAMSFEAGALHMSLDISIEFVLISDDMFVAETARRLMMHGRKCTTIQRKK